jgi:hypothetical protein
MRERQISSDKTNRVSPSILGFTEGKRRHGRDDLRNFSLGSKNLRFIHGGEKTKEVAFVNSFFAVPYKIFHYVSSIFCYASYPVEHTVTCPIISSFVHDLDQSRVCFKGVYPSAFTTCIY